MFRAPNFFFPKIILQKERLMLLDNSLTVNNVPSYCMLVTCDKKSFIGSEMNTTPISLPILTLNL